MAIQVTRTYVGDIQNHQQVQSDLDSLGDAASKIWNVARWTADRVWEATDEIPDEGTLKAYMKPVTAGRISTPSQVRKSSKNFLTPSSRGSMCDRRMRQLTRPATAKSTTLDRAQQSRSGQQL